MSPLRWPIRPPTAAPTGINVALGSVGVVVAALVCAGVSTPTAPAARLVALAVVVGGLARLTGDLVAATATAGIAWLVLNGFLINQLGVLSWHGPADAWRLAALGGAAVGGWLVAVVRRGLRHRRQVLLLRFWLEHGGFTPLLTANKEESSRG